MVPHQVEYQTDFEKHSSNRRETVDPLKQDQATASKQNLSFLYKEVIC